MSYVSSREINLELRSLKYLFFYDMSTIKVHSYSRALYEARGEKKTAFKAMA
jgi:hypothetical protein